MYKLVKSMCSTQNRAPGPGIDPEIFFTNPSLQEDCIKYVTRVPRKEFSLYMTELLDLLGYSYEMIKDRQQKFDEFSTILARRKIHFDRAVITGSKGEGTALVQESDMDFMYIGTDVICADCPQDFSDKEDITLFQTERQEAPPGYTRLKLLKFEGDCCYTEIEKSLFESETGSRYLSSQFFTDTYKTINGDMLASKFVRPAGTSGPAIFSYYKDKTLDNVHCFKCFCPDILERWVSRPRYHGWPSPDTIHEISLLDGHVVPVGLKGSENMYKEWRICYSLAELHLMRTFNETQLKVYILLKKISKSILNPVFDDMTSYIMKNVVFWMCEANGVDRFTKDLLMDRLFDCIKYLRTCVSENNLPSYMIPERNLLAGRLDIQQRQQLTSLLGDLLRKERKKLLKCDKLRDAMLVMYETPDMFREFGEKRDQIERLVLLTTRATAELLRPEMSLEDTLRLLEQNEQFRDICKRTRLLMHSYEEQLIQEGKNYKEIKVLLEARLNELIS